MRHNVAHFFIQSRKHLSDTLNDGDPAKFIRLGAILDATELVVQLLAPRTWLAVTEGVGLAGLRIVDT